MSNITASEHLITLAHETLIKDLRAGEWREINMTEQLDPNGKQANEAGAKLDAGKPRVGLVMGDFASALEEVSKVGTAGANKYSPHGWLTVPDGIERYTDAMQRHYLKECKGEMYDPELTEMTGEPIYHAACIAWNALARLRLIIDKTEEEKWNEYTQMKKDLQKNKNTK